MPLIVPIYEAHIRDNTSFSELAWDLILYKAKREIDFRFSCHLTLSPFFGQFRGFLKVDREPASCDHFINFEG